VNEAIILFVAGTAIGLVAVRLIHTALVWWVWHEFGEYAEYHAICSPNLSFWRFARDVESEPTYGKHCWHRPDTAKPPACCHCGKYHPDFKEKKDGPRKESTPVQGK